MTIRLNNGIYDIDASIISICYPEVTLPDAPPVLLNTVYARTDCLPFLNCPANIVHDNVNIGNYMNLAIA